MNEPVAKPSHFIRQIIDADLKSGKHQSVHSRFPPEPNGYLHIGHAKSICLNFGLAADYPGDDGKPACNLRFDDTNPEKEEAAYIAAIKQDVQWLGYEWHGDTRYASSYFDALFEYAVELIDKGLAYVCSLTAEQAREYRGSLTGGGKNSPFRERSIEENKALFTAMKNGEHKEGEHVLRAKIDMASPNMNLRDPILYRIRFVHHHQTADKWCVYPMYDFTHPISDAIEGITHSLCTLEFEDHRPLYDWVLDNISLECHPQQVEFARLNLSYTLTSKRKLKQLIDEQVVEAWDDPRMPTISGMRRRGYPAASIRHFCESIGVSKANSVVDVAMLEAAVRDDLNQNAQRRMGVLRPLKLTIKNYPADKCESLVAKNHPQDPATGERNISFSQSLWIDQADFREEGNKKYKRLKLGQEVRLRYSYVVKAEEVIKDAEGNIVEVICSYDPQTLGVDPADRKVKGVIHWVDAQTAQDAEVRLYDRLFLNADAEAGEGGFMENLNPNSMQVLQDCKVEASLAINSEEACVYQFEREGYFVADTQACDTENNKLVFNMTIGLRDNWDQK